MESLARLMITSDHMTSSQITDFIGFAGDNIWNAGDSKADAKVVESDSGLVFQSRLARSLDLSFHIGSIMSRLKGAERELLSFSALSGCEIQLSCVVYSDSAPPLNFEKAVMRWVGDIGASLDIDLYL
ncbi:DUF4279 domain-containing protein [Pseudomonas alliivorans]|nr:DUF4279 domain-containing protein [Pseudomonas alliivorans]MEE5148806.1 DUF4279 domain-containing protein [Pseudomonas alliivorans]